ncbi:hypothetical protein [Enterovibrio paralichthyis]|uniref:hypothetical protein n=1 Tax=Enterovibrio paralichthyis TaxID=2853805 RepID=UPI001C473285|nr:hypothetical protein [Enterovibrio paralichthyis]MBV7296486.1 hypothetical protein [Enterovibrio paralichthyis]
MKGIFAAVLCLASGMALAGKADVVDATATPTGDTWQFSATVQHADEGWDHYADAWRVVSAEGDVLGTRVLLHPHVNEQPFTRSLSGVVIPDGVEVVFIEAKDNVHGWGGLRKEVKLKSH